MRMARVNVYLPDELAREARAAGLNISRVAQEALEQAPARHRMRQTAGSIVSSVLAACGRPLRARDQSNRLGGTCLSSATCSRLEVFVVDASALVEALLGTGLGVKVRGRMRGHQLGSRPRAHRRRGAIGTRTPASRGASCPIPQQPRLQRARHSADPPTSTGQSAPGRLAAQGGSATCGRTVCRACRVAGLSPTPDHGRASRSLRAASRADR